jgi:hypothetical protein
VFAGPAFQARGGTGESGLLVGNRRSQRQAEKEEGWGEEPSQVPTASPILLQRKFLMIT